MTLQSPALILLPFDQLFHGTAGNAQRIGQLGRGYFRVIAHEIKHFPGTISGMMFGGIGVFLRTFLRTFLGTFFGVAVNRGGKQTPFPVIGERDIGPGLECALDAGTQAFIGEQSLGNVGSQNGITDV